MRKFTNKLLAGISAAAMVISLAAPVAAQAEEIVPAAVESAEETVQSEESEETESVSETEEVTEPAETEEETEAPAPEETEEAAETESQEETEEESAVTESETEEYATIEAPVYEAVKASGTDKNGLSWSLSSTGVLTISGSGDMYSTWTSDYPWYSYRSTIRQIVIRNGVTCVGSYAFNGYTSLTSVTIPGTVIEIKYDAFKGCTGLRDVTIGNGVSEIGENAFSGCTALQSVTIPDSVTTIDSRAFYNDSAVKSVTIGNGLSVIPSYCFNGCRSIAALKIGNSVSEIGSYAFSGCTSIRSLTLPKNVTNIDDGTFSGCTALKTLDTGDGLQVIGAYCFDGCTSLTSVTIGSSVTTIKYDAFRGCTSLKSIVIPNSVETIGKSAFNGCKALTSLKTGTGLTTIDSFAFAYCSALKTVSFGKNLTTIGSYAFYEDIAIENIVLPDNVNSMGSSAFSDCTSLKTVKIGNSLTEIPRSCFSSCSSLTSVTYGKNIVTISDYAFERCTSLPEINIPNGVVTISYEAFVNCTSAKSIVIGDSVTTIGGSAFYGDKAVTSVRIGSSVTTIGSYAFAYESALQTVVIGSSVSTINDNAFYECKNLKTVTFKGNAPAMSSHIFYGVPASGSTYAYYPKGDSTWTKDVQQQYGGKSIIWSAKKIYADKSFTVNRVFGDTRYATAIQSAEALKQVLKVSKFSNVVIVSGLSYPDALAGSPLAAKLNAPILLVGNEAGTTQTLNYVYSNLKSGGNVYIIGGEAAVSKSIAKTLKSKNYNVTRLAGDTRYETNLAIVKAMNVASGTPVVIVQGYTSYKTAADKAAKKNPQGYADSLSVSGVAGAKGMPIFLAPADGLTADQLAAIKKINPSKVYVIGGTNAVSSATESTLKKKGYTVTRIAGATRYETSVAIAKTFGLTKSKYAVIAYGQNFPDGLTGGVLAAKLGAPLLLVDANNTEVQHDFLYTGSAKTLYILGGINAISQETINKLIYND